MSSELELEVKPVDALVRNTGLDASVDTGRRESSPMFIPKDDHSAGPSSDPSIATLPPRRQGALIFSLPRQRDER